MSDLGKVLVEAAKQPDEQSFDCARTRCPFNIDGQRCRAPNLWYTCLRQKEP